MTAAREVTLNLTAAFVEQYYNHLVNYPGSLVEFYKDCSSFVWGHADDSSAEIAGAPACGQHATGLRNIKAQIGAEMQGLRDQVGGVQQVNLKNVDHQDSKDGAVIVQCVGNLVYSDKSTRPFVQTFFLGKQVEPTVGYYIHNDILRYLPIPVSSTPMLSPAPAPFQSQTPTPNGVSHVGHGVKNVNKDREAPTEAKSVPKEKVAKPPVQKTISPQMAPQRAEPPPSSPSVHSTPVVSPASPARAPAPTTPAPQSPVLPPSKPTPVITPAPEPMKIEAAPQVEEPAPGPRSWAQMAKITSGTSQGFAVSSQKGFAVEKTAPPPKVEKNVAVVTRGPGAPGAPEAKSKDAAKEAKAPGSDEVEGMSRLFVNRTAADVDVNGSTVMDSLNRILEGTGFALNASNIEHAAAGKDIMFLFVADELGEKLVDLSRAQKLSFEDTVAGRRPLRCEYYAAYTKSGKGKGDKVKGKGDSDKGADSRRTKGKKGEEKGKGKKGEDKGKGKGKGETGKGK